MPIYSQIQKIQFFKTIFNPFSGLTVFIEAKIFSQKQLRYHNGQRVTNVLQVTYSVNGDGGYVADVSYTGEAQVILFFSIMFVFQKLNWGGTGEVPSEQSFEYTM